MTETDVLCGGLPLARIEVLTPVSVIVPTFRERENLPGLAERLGRLRDRFGLELEVLVVDDDSRDGTEAWVRDEAPDFVRLLIRTEGSLEPGSDEARIQRLGGRPRGLSPAVIDGLSMARHEVLVVMDADLSHPPEKIPSLVLALEAGQQMVIGSRYVPGGSTDDDWGFFRWLNSKVATALARPFTDAKDPMSGFFALRRSDFERARELNPVGYKVGLELIVKCSLENVGEVPIHFTDRVLGQSKLTLKEQLAYLRHLRRLYMFRYATWSSFVQFALVGASGVVVNLTFVTLFALAGSPEWLALLSGILTSIVSNFALNWRFTFPDARMRGTRGVLQQFAGFVGASSVGASLQYGLALLLVRSFPALPLQVAALAGIAAGMVVNYAINRYFVFKTKHPPRPKKRGV